MYSKLKALMSAKGYTVSKGGDWTPQDNAQFRDFAHFVMGVPYDEAYRVITHISDYEQHLARIAKEVLGSDAEDSMQDMITAANAAGDAANAEQAAVNAQIAEQEQASANAGYEPAHEETMASEETAADQTADQTEDSEVVESTDGETSSDESTESGTFDVTPEDEA